MLSLDYPEILPQLAKLVYGLQPARLPDGRFLLIIKASKDVILTTRLNNGFKLYLIPDPNRADGSLGLISAFFDDHDEPLVILTPLFAGDALLNDLVATLSQDQFELYLLDEHDRELVGAISQVEDVMRFRNTLAERQFPPLALENAHATYAAMTDWFGLRTPEDDEKAFCVALGERLYPDDMVTIDARDQSYNFQGSEGRVITTSLERKDPGVYQEQDIVALLRRGFLGESIFLNPVREDTGKELCDVLVVNDKFLVLVQAKDSPNTEAALRRSINRKRSIIRAHIDKGARQLRGALRHCREQDQLVLRTRLGLQTVDIADRAICGIVVVREMFDDDYKACSQPVLEVARDCHEPCVLLDYPALHMLARRLASPERFINGLYQLFEAALQFGEFPKPRFTGKPSDQ